MDNIFWILGIVSGILLIVVLKRSGVFSRFSTDGLHMPSINQQFIFALLASAVVLWIRLEGWILPDIFKQSWVTTTLMVVVTFWVIYKKLLIKAIALIILIYFVWRCISASAGETGTQVTFTLYCEDSGRNVVSKEVLKTPWQGTVCDYFTINPTEGTSVKVFMPGPNGTGETQTIIYGQRVEDGKPIYVQPLPPRGYGRIKIIAQ